MHATMMLQVGICETLQGIPSLVGSLRAKANADHIRLTDWLNLEFLVERSQQRLVLEDCGGIALVHRNPPPSRIRHRVENVMASQNLQFRIYLGFRYLTNYIDRIRSLWSNDDIPSSILHKEFHL